MTLYHVNESFHTIGDATRCFHELYRHIAKDTSLSGFSEAAIQRAVYKADPPCIWPRACAGACKKLCAGDIWSTPEYHKHVCDVGDSCGPVVEDCDGQTLLGAPRLRGRPLFCDGGDQLHVLTLPEETGDRRAVDLSVRAGMPPFRGRRCFWYDDGGKPTGGHLEGPFADDRGKLSIFTVRKEKGSA